MLCTYYRGRTTFMEMMSMPLSYINTLYMIAKEQSESKEGQERKEQEILEDEMEAALL